MNLEAEVIEILPEKEVNLFGIKNKVAVAIIKDTNKKEHKLNLWNEQISLIKKGDKIFIINGYIKNWNKEPYINIGKFGRIEVIK